MTLWKNLVVALVAAFVLAACSSSDNDPTSADMGMEQTADEQELATLRAQIADLQEQLELDADDNIGDSITALQNEVTRLQGLLQDAADAEAAAEAEAMRKAMAMAGKALKGVLDPMPLGYAVTVTSFTGAGVMATMNHDRNDTTDLVTSPRLAPGDSAGSLGAWDGQHYSNKNAGTGVLNQALIYSNQAAPTVKPFAEGASFGANQAAFEGAYTAATRTLELGDPDSSSDIAGDMFPTAGTTTYTPDTVSNNVVIRGTYQGAMGNYRCSGTACSAEAEDDGAIDLTGQWFFVHDSGAMTSKPDANYLYFGWWLQKNKDDEPTLASVFAGVQGDVDGDTALTNPNTLAGTATYSGHAAGKFAKSDPLTGGDAGHFTADATLTATFGATADGGGLTGTLDNFMANDQAVPWSVSLLRATWHESNVGATEAYDDPDTSGVVESTDATVWSIDGNSAAADGSWSAQMYDEMPGNAPDGDGSNVPTSVTGSFQSTFGSTHTMVGAFGATMDN